jgi:hypothetical protein
MPQWNETDDKDRIKHHRSGHVENTSSQTIEEKSRENVEQNKRDREITDLRAASTISEIFFFPFSPFIAPLILNIPLKIDEKLMFMS